MRCQIKEPLLIEWEFRVLSCNYMETLEKLIDLYVIKEEEKNLIEWKENSHPFLFWNVKISVPISISNFKNKGDLNVYLDQNFPSKPNRFGIPHKIEIN